MTKREAATSKAPQKKTASKAADMTAEPTDIDKSYYQRNLFLIMLVDMTWQLAIVVIVPIVGGYYLDQYFHTFPGLLIAGFILAALGVVGVLIRVVNKANRKAGLK